MKTSPKLVAGILAAIVLVAGAITSGVIRAQEAVPPPVQTPAPVTIVNKAPSQYKVIDIGLIPVAKGLTPAGTLEAVLNDFGARGWKVVTTSGSYVILSQ